MEFLGNAQEILCWYHRGSSLPTLQASPKCQSNCKPYRSGTWISTVRESQWLWESFTLHSWPGFILRYNPTPRVTQPNTANPEEGNNLTHRAFPSRRLLSLVNYHRNVDEEVITWYLPERPSKERSQRMLAELDADSPEYFMWYGAAQTVRLACTWLCMGHMGYQ